MSTEKSSWFRSKGFQGFAYGTAVTLKVVCWMVGVASPFILLAKTTEIVGNDVMAKFL